jgi:4-amino-4-deoxy-L-arabinose transferase-like glycosyltransferase
VAVYFVGLGTSSIWDANEAFYVETPREMLAAHDLINPSFNYLPRFNKPVLSYWMVAGLYKLFGTSVAVQRVGIALGALLIIGCAAVLGALVMRDPRSAIRDAGFGIRDPGFADEGLTIRDSAPLFAAAGLAVSPRLIMFARRIFIDVWITAFLSLALTFFALSEHDPARRRLYLVLMYVAIGLGTLTKGPVALVLPALAAALYLIVTRDLRRVRDLMIPLGIGIVAAIVLPWYVALYQQHGGTYIKSFLVSENVQRFTSGYGVTQRRGLGFYFPVVLTDSFPISVFLFAAAAAAAARRQFRRQRCIETLLWCWIIAIVAFFSFSAGKQDLYILPIVPAVAALGGAAIERGMADPRWRRWLAWTGGIAGVLVVVAGAVVLRLFAGAGRIYALDGAVAVGALSVAGGLLVLALTLVRRPQYAALTLLAAILACDWVFVIEVLPAFERYKPVFEFSAVLKQRLKPDELVVEYQVALPSLVYYLQRHVDEYFDEAPFVGAMTSAHHVYAVLGDDDYAALEPRIGARTCVIDRRPTFDAKLNHILARQPEPQLLLISNVCP